MIVHPTLYNIDSKGKVRIWYLESDGPRYRAISGLKDGKKVTSEWTTCEPKNVGRSNATTAEQQALSEVHSLYIKKLEKKYTETLEDAGGVKFFEPMLATKWKDRKSKLSPGTLIYSQPKLDGIRCSLTEKEAISRGGKPFMTVAHIHEALQEVFDRYPNIRFDGELYNHDFHNDFDTVSSLIKQQKPTQEDIENAQKYIQYHIYDLPSHNGRFSDRISALVDTLGWRIIDDPDSPIKVVSTVLCRNEDHIDELYGKLLENNYEGQILRLDELYESGRSNFLMKRKEFMDAEFEVIDLEEGKGEWWGMAKAVVYRMPDGRLTKNGDNPRAGIKGSKKFCRDLLNRPLPKTVTIRYPNLTPEGIPRFGVAVDFQEEEGRIW